MAITLCAAQKCMEQTMKQEVSHSDSIRRPWQENSGEAHLESFPFSMTSQMALSFAPLVGSTNCPSIFYSCP